MTLTRQETITHEADDVYASGGDDATAVSIESYHELRDGSGGEHPAAAAATVTRTPCTSPTGCPGRTLFKETTTSITTEREYQLWDGTGERSRLLWAQYALRGWPGRCVRCGAILATSTGCTGEPGDRQDTEDIPCGWDLWEVQDPTDEYQVGARGTTGNDHGSTDDSDGREVQRSVLLGEQGEVKHDAPKSYRESFLPASQDYSSAIEALWRVVRGYKDMNSKAA